MLDRIAELKEDGEIINEKSLNTALALYNLLDDYAIEKSKITLDPEDCIYMTIDQDDRRYILRFRGDGTINFVIMKDKKL